MSAPVAVQRRTISPRDLRINPAVFEGALPVVVFWVLNHFADARVAIAASFAAAIVVYIRNRDSGVIRFLGTVGFVGVTVSAVVGVLLESDKAFAAQNILGDVMSVPIGVGTILVGRPLVGLVTRELVPAVRPYMAVDHSVFVWLTVISVGTNATTAVIRWFMLGSLDTNDYVILSRLLGAPFSIVYYAVCFFWIKYEVEKVLNREPASAALPAG